MKFLSYMSSLVNKVNPVNRWSQYFSEEEKKKREEEERKRKEWRGAMAKEEGIPTMGELFTKAKEKVVGAKEKVSELISKPETRTQFKEETIKPAMSKQYTRENILAALDPSKYLQTAFKQFIYKPESGGLFPSTIIRDFNEISKLPVGSPERLAREIKLGTTMAYFLSSAPQAKGQYPRTSAEARKILNVGEKATQEEVKQAATKLLTKEFPEHIKSLATRYKVNEANLIWRAANKLWEGVVPKPLLTAGGAVTGKVEPKLPITAAVQKPIPVPKPIPVAPQMPVEEAIAPKVSIVSETKALKQARPGSGQFQPGEVYEQDLGPLGTRQVLIGGIDEKGIQGWYLPSSKEAVLLGQKGAYLTPATFKPTDLKPSTTPPKDIKKAISFMFPEVERVAGIQKAGQVKVFPEVAVKLPTQEGLSLTPQQKIEWTKQHEFAHRGLNSLRTGELLETTNLFSELQNVYKSDNLTQEFDEAISNAYASYQVKPEFLKQKAPNLYNWFTQNKDVFGKVSGGGLAAIEKPPKVTIAQIEKEATTARFKAFLDQSKTQEDFVKRVNALSKQLDRPEVKINKTKVKKFRNIVNNEIKRKTGYEMTGDYKKDFAILQTAKEDPEIAPSVKALEDFIVKDVRVLHSGVLKILRDIRGKIPKSIPLEEKITPRQIKIIRAMRKSLKIKNREMLPILDELINTHSFARMTKEDGIKIREWLQPRNWDIIENKIAQTREMISQERKITTLGNRFAAKNQELEDKYKVLTSLNQTAEHMENMVATLENLPMPKKGDSKAPGEFVAGIADNLVSEETATKMLGIRTTFHVPLRMVIRIGDQFEKNFNKALQSIPKDLTKEVQKQVMFKQAQAKKFYEGVISDEALTIAKYVQEVADANLALINRIRVARGIKPLVGKDNYITYTLAENIKAAAEFGDKVRFWEARVKGPQDFAVGLFEQDMSAVFKVWAKSSASWLKKNLYMAYMQDRFDALSDVSTRAAQYARTIVELDIFDMLPASEKGIRSSGRVLNEQAGKIMPFKIKLDNPLLKSIQNTALTKDLKIVDGYLYVPRFKVPSLTTSFLRFFYPAKLAGNLGFGLVNLQQPWHMLPFIGLGNTLHTRATAWTVLLPWNKEYRAATLKALEQSGYELDMVSGDKVPRFEWQGKLQVAGKILDKTLNGVAYITEFLNRVEPIVGVDRYLLQLDKKGIVKTTPEQRFRIGAQFSATINYIYGKGYSPVAQRTITRRVLYTFVQYPVNTYNLYHEMYKYAAKDKYAVEFWQNLSREALLPAEITEEFNKLPPTSKMNFFLIALALTMGPALIYALTRSYSAAQRAYPGIPRISVMPLLTAASQYALNPTDDNKDKMNNALKSTFSIGSLHKLVDAMNIQKYGFVNTSSGRPIFIEPNLRNIALTSTFGKSTTKPYEEAYPSFLGKMLGGEKTAEEAAKLRSERKDINTQASEDAIQYLKLRKNSEARTAFIETLRQEGRFTDNFKEKVAQYIKEQATGTGPLERNIIGLNDVDQAKLILKKLDKIKDNEERIKQIMIWKRQGIITDSVIEEITNLKVLERVKKSKEKPSFFKGLFTR